MDHQIVGGKIFREIIARYDLHIQRFAKFLFEHARDFHPSDIFFQRRVGTSFRNENMRFFGQPVNRRGSICKSVYIPLIRREQHRKGGQPAFRRFRFVDLFKALRIRYNQRWRFAEVLKAFFKFSRRSADCSTAIVEKLPDRLYLRQDQPSLGRLNILGHYQQNQVSFPCQTAENPLSLVVLRNSLFNGCFDRFDAFLPQSADEDGLFLQFFFNFFRQLCPIVSLICLTHNRDDGNFLFFHGFHPAFFLGKIHIIENHNGHVRLVQDLPCLLHPQLSQFAFIIKTGCIDKDYRTDRMKFHGFIDRIGRGSRMFGNHGNLLPGQRVGERGFSGVALSENSNMQPVCPRRCV